MTDDTKPGPLRIEFVSVLSARTKRGAVDIIVNDARLVQLELDKAREVAGLLAGAIEAATTDEILWRWLQGQMGLDDQAAAAALLDFRELRQGSRATVWPQ